MDAGVSRFFIPAIDSTCTQAMYDLENNYPENVFLMMGLHPTYVKDNFFGGITTCGGRTNTENSMQLAKLVSICIGTKPICLSSKSPLENKFNWQNTTNYLS
jgi:Tat protein secretion system quality control protein TatD with DNase activity